MTKRVGILGGTFNPVHQGHIRCALHVLTACHLDEVRLMPCHLPPHRATPGVSSEQRAHMVQLAIQPHPRLVLERLELNKNTPSYTVESLTLLRDAEPDSQFYFIIGMDSLCYFRQWKDWQGIMAMAHVLVCRRPGYSSTEGDAPFLLQHFAVDDLQQLQQHRVGKILLLDNPLTNLSASQLRQALRHHHMSTETLDPAVLNYIQTEQLYLG